MDVRIKQFTIETIPSDLYFNPIFCKRYGDNQIWCIELHYGRPCYEPLDVLKVAVNSTKKFLKNYQDNNNELCIFKMIAHIQMEFDEDATRYPFFIVKLPSRSNEINKTSNIETILNSVIEDMYEMINNFKADWDGWILNVVKKVDLTVLDKISS